MHSQARRKVEELKLSQQHELSAMLAQQVAGVQLEKTRMSRMAKKERAEKLMELETKQLELEMKQCVGLGGVGGCFQEEALTHGWALCVILFRLESELKVAVIAHRKAGRVLTIKWHKVSAPVRAKQAELQAISTTSQHRAARLRWESDMLSRSLADEVVEEKAAVSC